MTENEAIQFLALCTQSADPLGSQLLDLLQAVAILNTAEKLDAAKVQALAVILCGGSLNSKKSIAQQPNLGDLLQDMHKNMLGARKAVADSDAIAAVTKQAPAGNGPPWL